MNWGPANCVLKWTDFRRVQSFFCLPEAPNVVIFQQTCCFNQPCKFSFCLNFLPSSCGLLNVAAAQLADDPVSPKRYCAYFCERFLSTTAAAKQGRRNRKGNNLPQIWATKVFQLNGLLLKVHSFFIKKYTDKVEIYLEQRDVAQRPTIDLNKRFLPRPNSTTA